MTDPETSKMLSSIEYRLKENRISWVQCQFTDITGRLRSFTISADQLYADSPFWEEGMIIDGSSVGFAATEDSDLLALPDPRTFNIFPYEAELPEPQRTARIICGLHSPTTLKPHPLDPRGVAMRAFEELQSMGYTKAWLQPELEFFLLPSNWRESESFPGPYPILPKLGYFASPPQDITDEFRNEFSYYLRRMGLNIKFHHHEGGVHQVEIEFRHRPSPVDAGDAAILYKFLSRIVAGRRGFIVSYIPKISSTDAGNGMHVHLWLEKKGGSAFRDETHPLGLSRDALSFIAGVLEHAREISAITNPTINSYKRLIPEFEAPVYLCWGPRNRTALIRVPGSKKKNRVGDIEVRNPDPSSNPYLTFAAILWAGMDGVRRGLEPPEMIKGDPNKMSEEERRKMGIKRLPGNLEEAIEEFSSSELMRKRFGREFVDTYVEMKRREVLDYKISISPWEIERYFDV
ncbi:MAG: glutamine synthetase [Thermoplasmata archaeon]|nr:glutamine synthetase [Thermoplasmata archaeon]